MELPTTEQLILTREQQQARERVYSKLKKMEELKQQPMPHFSGTDGDRSFLSYIDASERLLNGYTPSREDQGKDAWQSNVMDNTTRAKLRAICAGVGLKVPEMKYRATNKNALQSRKRAEIMYQTVRHSFYATNPTLHAFRETWQMLGHGVLFEYEGYLSGGAKQKVVTSFNSETGEVEVEEKYVRVNGRPISIIINPQDMYWADWYRSSIQDQPYIAWVQRYSKVELEQEFSKFPNYKYVEDKATASRFAFNNETLYYKAWSDRVEDRDDYEVIRFYSKEDDAYEIWVNGVPLLIAPLLWGGKEKEYPFAHTIAEPFANTNFMVGMSLPHILEGYQDMKSTTLNTMVDKLYRSLTPPYLVGLANRDLLDVEAELVNQDNRYYVPDVNQVKPFPFEGVSQSDLAMYQLMNMSIDRLSVDVTQQGQQGSGVTAREVIIADERARQLKGIIFMYLEDLWLQKNRLRVNTILTHYLKDKATQKDLKDNIITVQDVAFDDGSRGTLDIHVAATKSKLLPLLEIEAREQAMKSQGINYKLISITKDYLDEWEYDFEVIPQSLFNQDRIRKEADIKEKLQTVVTLFPEFFIANKDKFLDETLSVYDDAIENYELPPEEEPQPVNPEGVAPQGQQQGSILGLE